MHYVLHELGMRSTRELKLIWYMVSTQPSTKRIDRYWLDDSCHIFLNIFNNKLHFAS